MHAGQIESKQPDAVVYHKNREWKRNNEIAGELHLDEALRAKGALECVEREDGVSVDRPGEL